MLETAGVVASVETFAGSRTVDIDDPGVLERSVRMWFNEETNPEEFATVMSALRDCTDESTRRRLLDQMISFAFRESTSRFGSEAEWRGRVEATLTDAFDPNDAA
jgi:hypothetical protein